MKKTIPEGKSKASVRKIAVVTGGGDAPGLNAVIRAVTISAHNRGWEVYGIKRGFEGLLHRSRVERLDAPQVHGIIHIGGTIQRGGSPTASDRLLATRFGAAAVRAIERGESNRMVALRATRIVTVPLAKAVSRMKSVPTDSDIIMSARELGVSFGDD